MREDDRERVGPRIAYVLKRFPRLSETFIANEILALERRGFEALIFSMKRPEGKVHSFVRKIKSPVIYLPSTSGAGCLKFIFPHLYTFFRRPSGYIRCLLYSRSHGSREAKKKFVLAGYVSRYVLGGRVQHLHSHFATGSTRLAKYVRVMTGIPFSFTAHAKDIFSDRVSEKQLRRRMNMAKFVVTISEYNRRYLKNFSEDATIHVVRNGIPIQDFSPNGKNGDGEKVPIVLSVGRFVEKKGYSHLIDACAELKRQHVKCRLVIVGDGPLKPEIEEQIDRLNLSDYVTLEGFKTHDVLANDYYRKATIFALSCKEAENRDRDGIPVVLEEAMAIGVPVITTKVAGIPELVQHNQTGLLVEPEDSAGMAGSIRDLLADDSLRRKLKKSARKIVEQEYDIESTSQKLADLFTEAIGES